MKSSPVFAAVAVASLALGIGANTAIFTILNAVILRPLPVESPRDLLDVTVGKNGSFTNPIWEQLRGRQQVFSGVFAWGNERFNIAPPGETQYAQGVMASGGFFTTLGVPAVLGRTFTHSDDRRGASAIAVLSYGFWQAHYGGDAGVVGHTLRLDGHPFEIVGVTAPGFTGADVGRAFDVAIPLACEPIIRGKESSLDHRSFWWLSVIGRLKPGITAQHATAGLKSIARAVYEATIPPTWAARDQSEYLNQGFEVKSAAAGESDLRRNASSALWMLMTVAGLVLLIACANIANLLLARSAARQREIAVRQAIGATRGRLIRQLLTESLLLSAAGAALGVLFAQWGSRLLVGYFSTDTTPVFLDLAPDWRMLAFTAGVAALTTILFGLAPAFRATRVPAYTAMKEGGRSLAGGTRFRLGRTLLVVQLALSTLLVIGAALFVRTLRNLTALDAGFHRQGVLLMSLDLRKAAIPAEQRRATLDDALARLRALPGVKTAAQTLITPVSGRGWNDQIIVEGFVPKSRMDAMTWFNRVSSGYFETMGTPILSGRDFNSGDTPGAPLVAIVNEAAAKKFFGTALAVGRTFVTKEPDRSRLTYRIIAVVKDAKYRNLREKLPLTAYLAMAQEPPVTFGQDSATFVLRAHSAPAGLIAGAKEAIHSVHPEIAMEFRLFATQLDESLRQERMVATLSGFFGGLALLISAVGLYGVISYLVARRRNEIGIRMALGAQPASVLRMVLGDAGKLTAAGLAIGIVAAAALTKLVQSMLYGLTPTDPAALAGGSLTLAAVALLAGYLPARRASRLDPMTALREE